MAELILAVAAVVAAVAVDRWCRAAERRLIRRRAATIGDPVLRADVEQAAAEWKRGRRRG